MGTLDEGLHPSKNRKSRPFNNSLLMSMTSKASRDLFFNAKAYPQDFVVHLLPVVVPGAVRITIQYSSVPRSRELHLHRSMGPTGRLYHHPMASRAEGIRKWFDWGPRPGSELMLRSRSMSGHASKPIPGHRKVQTGSNLSSRACAAPL